jgi:predicted nucleotidyltransferase
MPQKRATSISSSTWPGRSLLDLGGLVMDLQDLLQRDVDVVTERGLRPRVAKRVLAEAVEL